MKKWRQFLKRWAPREDATTPFYPDKLDNEKPVLLNETGPVAAGFVAARVLRAVALRGGTLVSAAALERLERFLRRGLSEEALHHCEAEAEAVLHWLEAPPNDDGFVPGRDVASADLDLMVAADLESRLSVARFALEEGFDLELEYFDEERQVWPRLTAALDDVEGSEAADFDTALVLRDGSGPFTIPLKHVRWLMPVSPRDYGEGDEGGADVLQFPRK